MTDLEKSRQIRQQRRVELAAKYEAELAEVEARKGELPRRDLSELQLLKQQIDAARTEKQAAKETLVATRIAEQAKKDQLQLDLAAATKAADRQAIRTQIDACNAKLDQARLELTMADAVLQSLITAKEDALLEERLTKGELLPGDDAKIADRKEQQAKECEEKRAWLARRQTA